MGSGASKSQLKCPKDYEPEKFKKILKLFDRLDSNGDQVVETDELVKIADLHVRNKIRKYKNYIEKVKNDTEQKIKELDHESTVKINQINSQLLLKIKKAKDKKTDDIKCAEYTIDILSNMSAEEKSKKFKDAVSDSKGHIEFWKFYEYMKHRTDDIENIIW